MRVVIDRFEGLYAVCEKDDRTMINIEKSKIPDNANEGDDLDITDNKITISDEETINRKEYISEITKDLWN